MCSVTKLLILSSFLICGITSIFAEPKTLVLLDNFITKETHSAFFQTLKDIGHSLIFKLADDASLSLNKYGKLLYDNLVIFSPNVEEFGGLVSKSTILDFVDAGGNLLLTTGHKPGSLLRELGAECGVEVDITGNIVMDHFNYDINGGFNDTLIAVESDNLLDAPIIVGSKNIAPILYEGGGLLINKTNPLVLPILKAYDTSYSYNPSKIIDQTPDLIGENIALIAGIQTRNNARIIVTGSLYIFSNDAFGAPISKVGGKTYPKSGNQKLSEALAKWVFKESGVIRVKSVSHHKVNEKTPPVAYTITEMVVFTMEIEQKEGNKWVPFDTNDIQLEFVRIDPFIRTLIPRISNGKYQVIFKIPDIYGVFKFKVDYRRIGYTAVFSSTQVSVRPLKHTEYERFIGSAFPYYTSAFSMMFGVFLLSLVVLHSDTTDGKDKKE